MIKENMLMTSELIEFLNKDSYKKWLLGIKEREMCGVINLVHDVASIAHIEKINGDEVSLKVVVVGLLEFFVSEDVVDIRFDVSKVVNERTRLLLFPLPNKKNIHEWPEQLRMPLLYSFGKNMVNWGYNTIKIT